MTGDRIVSILIAVSGVLVAIVQGFIARRQNRANEGLTTAQATEIIQRAAAAMVEDQAEQLTELRKRLTEVNAEATALKNQATSMAEELREANRLVATYRALLVQHGVPVPEAS